MHVEVLHTHDLLRWADDGPLIEVFGVRGPVVLSVAEDASELVQVRVLKGPVGIPSDQPAIVGDRGLTVIVTTGEVLIHSLVDHVEVLEESSRTES